jgi:outer membrane protein OmpA-like peptidoglycan-associated protein
MKRFVFLAVMVVASAQSANADPRPHTASAYALGEVQFAFDSSALPSSEDDALSPAATFAQTHTDARIVLDAHCDPIGTAPYNVGLAIRRAETVRDRLIALGVPSEQVVFAVYGKAGADRPTYADDRRVTLWATREPLADVIERTFDGGGPAVTWEQPLTTAQVDAAPAPVAQR